MRCTDVMSAAASVSSVEMALELLRFSATDNAFVAALISFLIASSAAWHLSSAARHGADEGKLAGSAHTHVSLYPRSIGHVSESYLWPSSTCRGQPPSRASPVLQARLWPHRALPAL